MTYRARRPYLSPAQERAGRQAVGLGICGVLLAACSAVMWPAGFDIYANADAFELSQDIRTVAVLLGCVALSCSVAAATCLTAAVAAAFTRWVR